MDGHLATSGSGFEATSNDIHLVDGHLLRANCRTIRGPLEASELDLNLYIGNVNGTLVWRDTPEISGVFYATMKQKSHDALLLEFFKQQKVLTTLAKCIAGGNHAATAVLSTLHLLSTRDSPSL